MKKMFLPVLVVVTLVLTACGKPEFQDDGKGTDVDIFDFQVIKSPVTGKCYEVVILRRSHRVNHISEVSCDYKK